MKRNEIYLNETKRNGKKQNVMHTKTGRECNFAKRIYRNRTKVVKTEYVETYMPVPSPIWMTIGA